MKRLALIALFISVSVPAFVYAQNPGVSCSGDNYLFSGTCTPSASCPAANTDFSASCTGGYVCCKASAIDTTGGSNLSGGVNQKYLQYYYQLILWAVNSILVPILIAVAFIVFLWGIFKAFIYNAASESEKAEGRKFAMWGIIGLVIIMSVWGLVNIVRDTIVPSTVDNKAPAYPKL